MTTGVETIAWNGVPLAHVIRADLSPPATTFVTPDESAMQVGMVVHPAGNTIRRHRHRPRQATSGAVVEVLVVRRGRCEVDVYTDTDELAATRELCAGDAIVLVHGGHGFRILEDTVLFEVKQGPYPGAGDKDVF